MDKIGIKSSVSFKAIPVAKTLASIDGAASEIKILKLTKDDFPFIEELKNKIKIKELLPNEPKADVYQKTLDGTFRSILESKDRDAFIAVNGSSPCGLLTARDGYDNMSLLYIVSLPVNFNERIANTGKSLMRHFLALFEKSENGTGVVYPEMKNIEKLEPYYKKFGFNSSLVSSWRMILPKKELSKSIKTLEKELSYKKIDGANDVDLFRTLEVL